MKIGKLFEFENAHIVRDCSSKRCRTSIHGHSYKLEIVLSASELDNAGMVYDFGLLKQEIKQIIDAFDHSISLFSGDNSEYLAHMKRHSARWVQLPCNISAENLSMVFFALIDKILHNSVFANGEGEIKLEYVKLNETRTGWAMCERADAVGENGYKIDLEKIIFSDAIKADFDDFNLLENIINGKKIINKTEV